MKNLSSGLLFCLIIIPFFSGVVVSADIIGDTMGMSSLDYHLYEDIRRADLIVQGTLFDQESVHINGTGIQTEGKIYIKKILKQSNTSNVTEGMTIEEYVEGGRIGNNITCTEDGCPRSKPGETLEGTYFLKNWDPTGRGRYYRFKMSTLSNDILKPAITNTEKGLPIELPDMSYAAQLEREKKGTITTTAVPNIINITPSVGSAGTKTQLIINGTGFGEKQSVYSNADVIFYSGYNKEYPDYFASGRQDTDHNKIK